jgi:hypothetical protein
LLPPAADPSQSLCCALDAATLRGEAAAGGFFSYVAGTGEAVDPLS